MTDDSKRTEWLSLRLSAGEKEAIRKAAKKAGISVSEYMRRPILDRVAGGR